MSKKENQDYDVIPVHWWAILAVIAFFGISWVVLYVINQSAPDSKIYFLLVMLPFGAAWIVGDLGKNYILTKESITYRIFSVPYRTILWENVIQIGIAVYGTGRHIETRIILTLKGCPKYVPEKERGHTYHNRHLEKTLTIQDPDSCYKLFEKYYGRLDYGYEKLDFFRKIFKK